MRRYKGRVFQLKEQQMQRLWGLNCVLYLRSKLSEVRQNEKAEMSRRWSLWGPAGQIMQNLVDPSKNFGFEWSGKRLLDFEQKGDMILQLLKW